MRQTKRLISFATLMMWLRSWQQTDELLVREDPSNDSSRDDE